MHIMSVFGTGRLSEKVMDLQIAPCVHVVQFRISSHLPILIHDEAFAVMTGSEKAAANAATIITGA